MSDLSDLSMMASSETLVPSSSSAGKSHKTAVGDHEVKVKKRKSEGNLETAYCHHCRQPCSPSDVIRCSHLKPTGKNGSTKKCGLAWCIKDLNRRYNIDSEPLQSAGVSFTCPCCLGQCQTASCRKKRGLESLGRVVNGSPATAKKVGDAKSPAIPNVVKPKPSEPKLVSIPATAPTAVKATAIFGGDSDSDLSSLSDENAIVGDSSTFAVPSSSRGTPSKPKATNAQLKRKSKASEAGEPSKKKRKSAVTNGEQKKGKLVGSDKGKEKKKRSKSELVNGEAKGKGKAKKSSKGEGKDVKGKPAPVRKPEVPPEPPVFEKVDTRLSYEDAQQKIALREYLWRFRSVLGIPERSLPPVDDFDRALSEASVRLFAGAMLEVIREEVEMYGDEDLVETLQHHREELRYYADLARFTVIYTNLEEPLDLRLPQSSIKTDFDPVELDVSTRRAGASRLPSPAHVVRMLLAFAERALSTPIIRADLDSQTEENALRRQHLSAMKRENTAWDIKKKKLEEARGKSKSAAGTKLSKQSLSSEMHEHRMRIAQLNVNLAADLSRRVPRHEALGADRDGRVYYVLSPRPVLDDGRPPTGWASGLLVYGKGVEGAPSPDDNLPVFVDRWSHFGKSKSVRQLVKWIEWNWKKSITVTKTKATKAKRAQVEVVIPVSMSRARSSSSSELSQLSEDNLIELYDTRGYEPSAEALDEQAKELVRRLKEVAEWLEVLEWKGMGEVV